MEMKDQETKFMANIAFIFKIITVIKHAYKHINTQKTQTLDCV